MSNWAHQEAAREAFVKHYYECGRQRGILRVFCGCGKTRIARMIIAEAISRGARLILVTTPLRTLVRQFAEELVGMDGVEICCKVTGALDAGCTRYTRGHVRMTLGRKSVVVIACNASVYRAREGECESSVDVRGKRVYSPLVRDLHELGLGFVVMDEAHHLIGVKPETELILSAIREGVKAMFMTATPLSTNDGKISETTMFDMRNRDTYGEIFYQLRYEDALKIRVMRMVRRPDNPRAMVQMSTPLVVQFEVVTIDGNQEAELRRCLSADKILENWYEVVIRWFFGAVERQRSRGRGPNHIVVYTSKCSHAKQFRLQLIELGFAADNVRLYVSQGDSGDDSKKVSDDMNANLAWFAKDGTTRILVTVHMLNEGINLPCCDGVLFAYEKNCMESTLVQNIGRALRYDTQNPGKVAVIFVPVVLTVDDRCAMALKYGKLRGVCDALMVKEPEYYSLFSTVPAIRGRRAIELDSTRIVMRRMVSALEAPQVMPDLECAVYTVDREYVSSEGAVRCDSIGNPSVEGYWAGVLGARAGVYLTFREFREMLVSVGECARKLIVSTLYQLSRRDRRNLYDGFTTYGALVYGHVPNFTHCMEWIRQKKIEFEDGYDSTAASEDFDIEGYLEEYVLIEDDPSTWGVRMMRRGCCTLRAYIDRNIFLGVLCGWDGVDVPFAGSWHDVFRHQMDDVDRDVFEDMFRSTCDPKIVGGRGSTAETGKRSAGDHFRALESASQGPMAAGLCVCFVADMRVFTDALKWGKYGDRDGCMLEHTQHIRVVNVEDRRFYIPFVLKGEYRCMGVAYDSVMVRDDGVILEMRGGKIVNTLRVPITSMNRDTIPILRAIDEHLFDVGCCK